MKLAAKINAGTFFVDRIVREAAVRTSKRIRNPDFRPEQEQRQKRKCGKDNGRNAHFEPHQRRDGPLAVSRNFMLWRTFGVFSLTRQEVAMDLSLVTMRLS